MGATTQSRGRWAAALFFAMAFTYQFGANPPIDYIRGLVGDTVQFAADGTTRVYVFDDSEIQMFTAIASGVWQSGQFYSGSTGVATLPSTPVNYLRSAALALDSMAANKAALASIKQLLDVKLDSSDAAIQLRAQAARYREIDDNSMAFVIIEQCNDKFSFIDRFWKTVQRQNAGVV
jgi:hypothetical protein